MRRSVCSTRLLSARPIESLSGVGPQIKSKLNKLGIYHLQDLLFHLPIRYQDRSHLTPLNDLNINQNALIQGEIISVQIQHGRRRSLLVYLQENFALLKLRFFYFSQAQKNAFQKGKKVVCFGEVRLGPKGYEMIHPEYQIYAPDQPIELPDHLTPIYPSTEGIYQSVWHRLIEQCLTILKQQPDSLPELLPDHILNKYHLMPIQQAIFFLHHPPVDADQQLLSDKQHPAQQRLAFEELLAHQLSFKKIRMQQQTESAPVMNAPPQLRQSLLQSLPFQLTAAQKRVCHEISQDMMRSQPMRRMLQGDVGSGKTIVAALAALQAIESGYQVALMAPTELLAEQHHRSFSHWLKDLKVSIGLLTSRLKGKARKALFSDLVEGRCQIILGTQALFQDQVHYHRLGLVIIDEQHRFGVHQRMALQKKGLSPHQLIMTATPIPRSLAMTAYADLDLSIIDELPPGRSPIKTVVLPDCRREEVIARLRRACQSGRQAYWVCPLIENSDKLQCQAAEQTWQKLKQALPEFKIGLVHGRLSPADKQQAMQSFKQGQLDILVATTVIEVGVDVPNASLMIIENPERLGLAQLHQLRGRVGRGSIDSFCVLMYHPPLSQQAQQRLSILRQSNDGFVIAQKDLQLRGPGEVLGIKQTGLLRFKIADLVHHRALMEPIQTSLHWLIQHQPESMDPLMQRWLAHKIEYAKV